MFYRPQPKIHELLQKVLSLLNESEKGRMSIKEINHKLWKTQHFRKPDHDPQKTYQSIFYAIQKACKSSNYEEFEPNLFVDSYGSFHPKWQNKELLQQAKNIIQQNTEVNTIKNLFALLWKEGHIQKSYYDSTPRAKRKWIVGKQKAYLKLYQLVEKACVNNYDDFGKYELFPTNYPMSGGTQSHGVTRSQSHSTIIKEAVKMAKTILPPTFEAKTEWEFDRLEFHSFRPDFVIKENNHTLLFGEVGGLNMSKIREIYLCENRTLIWIPKIIGWREQTFLIKQNQLIQNSYEENLKRFISQNK